MPVIYNKKVEYAYTDPGVKAHTLSWAEYQALSEDDKMNGDLYFIPDKQPEGNPSRIWTKLGTDPLTTQADDVSGAVNELNSSYIKQFATRISDLNTPISQGTSVIVFNVYASTASNTPTGNSGFVITLGAGGYRQQIAFELEGHIYSRYYNNGTITSWVKRSAN